MTIIKLYRDSSAYSRACLCYKKISFFSCSSSSHCVTIITGATCSLLDFSKFILLVISYKLLLNLLFCYIILTPNFWSVPPNFCSPSNFYVLLPIFYGLPLWLLWLFSDLDIYYKSADHLPARWFDFYEFDSLEKEETFYFSADAYTDKDRDAPPFEPSARYVFKSTWPMPRLVI